MKMQGLYLPEDTLCSKHLEVLGIIVVLLSTDLMKSRARYCTLKLGHFYNKEREDIVMVFVQ